MKTWWGLCPACGGQFGCACESCKERHPEQNPVVIIHELAGGISLEQCPHCGFVESMEWWVNLNSSIISSKEKYEKILKENKKDC